ncbi:MAG: AMP-binding protein [Pseudomonadota bacterium]|nr:AMP-binding protein [Pseudomonadota bacterium]
MDGVARAGGVTIGELLRQQARLRPGQVAVVDGGRRLTFAAFNARVNRLAHVLRGMDVGRGDRVAILSENCAEYLELLFALAKLGVMLCALNWRLAEPELIHCVRLTKPRLTVVSAAHVERLRRLDEATGDVIVVGEDYEDRLAAASEDEPPITAEPEDGMLILFTSGTTGAPKGALISHRAELARMHASCVDFALSPGDTFVAWAPMFHMVSVDQSIHTLCLGGTVIVVAGFEPDRLAHIIETERVWWLVLMPGMIEGMSAALRPRNIRPRGIKLIGAMADLVPRHQLAEITSLLGAPYANTFGSTETGLPPFSAGRIGIGETPERMAKTPSPSGVFRLVDPDDRDVADGTPGEVAVRGPTLFSGYWEAAETNARDFRGGWFHMGDVCVRRPDGLIDYVDRLKYMIKSGGENIYPAEIEQVLLRDPRVADAVVVRRADARWGEVPVAFVATRDVTVSAHELLQLCRRELAGYKQPKDVRFVREDELPRSTTGKIQRHEVEKWLRA